VYISSSAVITKSLIDLGWIANDEAEPMLGTLVYEDLFIAVYLAVASAIARSAAATSGQPPSTSDRDRGSSSASWASFSSARPRSLGSSRPPTGSSSRSGRSRP